jgi:hypothetical protein
VSVLLRNYESNLVILLESFAIVSIFIINIIINLIDCKMKNHDENQDVRILSRKFRVNSAQKAIYASRSDIIGIKTWARIDYLCHFCKYHLIWGDNGVVDKSSYEDSEKKKNLRAAKKAARQHTLTDKTKRTPNNHKND